MTTSASSSSLDDMDQEVLLEYLNSDSLGISFQEFQKREQQKHYLQNCPVFRDVSPADCERIAKSLQEINVDQGTVLIREGDMQGDAMYFLVEGELVAQSNGTLLATYHTPGSYFGELALIFKGQPRQATVRASERSKVYKLNKNAFYKSLQDSPVFDTARKMLLKKYSATRMRDTLSKISVNEFLDLTTARLQSIASKTILDSAFPFAMGASVATLAAIWSGTVQNGWPVLFDWQRLAISKLPVTLVTALLTTSALLGSTGQQKWRRLGIWAMVILSVFKSQMPVLLPMQMILAIVMNATKKNILSTPEKREELSTQQQQQNPKSKYMPVVVSCAILSYEVIRVLFWGA
jgi:CRP-like cAMP-binding protein